MKRTAVAEGRIGVRQLQRRDQQLTLTDREVDGGTGEPLAPIDSKHAGIELTVVIVTIGDGPGTLVRDLQTRIAAQTELARPQLDSLVGTKTVLVRRARTGPETLASDLVEVGVARDPQRSREIDLTAPAGVGAAEETRTRFLEAVRVRIGARVEIEVGRPSKTAPPSTPSRSAASAVISLNVEPGAYVPWIARLRIGEKLSSDVSSRNWVAVMPLTKSAGS